LGRRPRTWHPPSGDGYGIEVRRVTAVPARAANAPTLTARLRASIDVVYREMVKFGAVGAVAFVVDVGVFNLLRFGFLGFEGPLESKPLTAKAISAFIATIVAWLGNRYWTFRRRRRASRRREFLLFLLMNLAGLGIALLCLAFSHYVLGLRNALADNIAGNVIGLGLGTLFRFWAYKRFVFTHEFAEDLPPAEDLDEDGRRLVLDLSRGELAGEIAAALPASSPEHAELAADDLLAEELALAAELAARYDEEQEQQRGAPAGSAQGREA
jgi:putative flippase GtrA